MLPPCKDSLYKHAQRANYQAAIWRRSLSNEEIQNPIGHGWLLNESNEIEIEWMHDEPAPKAVLDLLSCNCKKACDEKCLKNCFKIVSCIKILAVINILAMI